MEVEWIKRERKLEEVDESMLASNARIAARGSTA